jgi:excinuclease UvrABC nuclease subunit
VHVDPSGRTPYFAKVARLLPPPGLCLGPFSSGRSAQGFMDIIQDAFDLCREPRRLAQAPHGRPCAYQQMGRCVGVCDGSMAMDVYRTVVAQAAAYAAGQRAGYLQELTERMKRAADQLRFEQAGAIKARLDRLRQLDGPAYAHVAEGEAFQFVLVQRGGGRKAAEVFLTDRGLIVSAPPLRWPLEDQQLQQTLDRVAGLVQDGSAAGRYDSWRVGLVASYLFSGPQRRGAILRWRRGMTGRELGQAVEQSAANLALGQEVEKDRARAGGTSSSTDAATPL